MLVAVVAVDGSWVVGGVVCINSIVGIIVVVVIVIVVVVVIVAFIVSANLTCFLEKFPN